MGSCKYKETSPPFHGDSSYLLVENSKYYDELLVGTLAKRNHPCGYCKQFFPFLWGISPPDLPPHQYGLPVTKEWPCSLQLEPLVAFSGVSRSPFITDHGP